MQETRGEIRIRSARFAPRNSRVQRCRCENGISSFDSEKCVGRLKERGVSCDIVIPILDRELAIWMARFPADIDREATVGEKTSAGVNLTTALARSRPRSGRRVSWGQAEPFYIILIDHASASCAIHLGRNPPMRGILPRSLFFRLSLARSLSISYRRESVTRISGKRSTPFARDIPSLRDIDGDPSR